jgi:hypothetical protein
VHTITPHRAIIGAVAHIWQRDMINSLYSICG